MSASGVKMVILLSHGDYRAAGTLLLGSSGYRSAGVGGFQLATTLVWVLE